MEVVSGSNKEEDVISREEGENDNSMVVGEISREEVENGSNTVVEVTSLAGVVNGSSKEEVISLVEVESGNNMEAAVI